MNMLNNYNQKEFRNLLKKAYDSAVCEKDKIKTQLESQIKELDPVELLSHISLLTWFTPEGKPESNQELREIPLVHFLAGVCLKSETFGNRHPDNQKVANIIDLLKKYFSYHMQILVFESSKKEEVPESDGVVLSSRLGKTVSQINRGVYEFQLDPLLRTIFGKFDRYFEDSVGFTISDAVDFGQKVRKRYERLVNERIDRARQARASTRRELEHPIRGRRLGERIRENQATLEHFLESSFGFTMFTKTKEIFVFTAEEFCKEERVRETAKFELYLEALSCRFGHGNLAYVSPLDENAIVAKPLIDIYSGAYFTPIPQDLFLNLPLIFEKFMETEKKSVTNVWQKYQKAKSNYAEDVTFKYLSRLFPAHNILRKLKYIYQSREFEVDLLIPYDNKIFIVESKAGTFTEPAQRGAVKRLKHDLKKLIEEAYQQGRRTRDYIKSTDCAVFKNEKGEKVLKVKYKPNWTEFFLINVTLEPLMSLATSLKALQSLGLFVDDEYPWSVNLFELDLITRHMPSPTVFIHYLERRLEAQDQDVFRAFDELTLFAWYLQNGNFYVPRPEEGKPPGRIFLDSSFVGAFDDHYLFGQPSPELKIEPDLLHIIRILEKLHPIGYSKIASAFLDLDHQARALILEKMHQLINLTKRDKKDHDFTAVYKDVLDMGFTFVTQCGKNGLTEKLVSYCQMKKYETKRRKWLGIGRDTSDDEWLVNEFVYLDFPWKPDAKADELVNKYLHPSAPGDTDGK